MSLNRKQLTRLFNQLTNQSKLFDRKYCDETKGVLQDVSASDVLKAHEMIIQGYERLISELSQEQQNNKADIYNNMHVQYEGLRKYYGICFDEASQITEKRKFLDNQIMLNAKCMIFSRLSRDHYAEKDKSYATEYLEIYEGIKKRLDDAKQMLDMSKNAPVETSASEIRVDDEAPPLVVRTTSTHTDAGIESLLSLRNKAPSDTSSESVSEEEHGECATTLLALATPRKILKQESIQLVNQCWRSIHLLAQSKDFEGHSQQANLAEAALLLASVKIALEDEKTPTNNHTFSCSTQGFMTQPKTSGVKRSREAVEEKQDAYYAQSSSSSSFHINA